ncbi:hypothetical protein [Streptomyces sp. ALB3]|uniref:hypothetical protein n=1 Tax=Streptomyces sp. ALB3 TaxID=3374278 RepID=UPI0037B2F8E3
MDADERPEPVGYLTVRCRRYAQPDGKLQDRDILQGGRTVALTAFTEDGPGILVRQYGRAPARRCATGDLLAGTPAQPERGAPQGGG